MTAARLRVYFARFERPYRLAVRTPPFHGGSTGSIPVRVAITLFSLVAFVVAAFVTPGVHDEENENDKAKNQEHNNSGFVFPKLLDAARDFVQIHACDKLHHYS